MCLCDHAALFKDEGAAMVVKVSVVARPFPDLTTKLHTVSGTEEVKCFPEPAVNDNWVLTGREHRLWPRPRLSPNLPLPPPSWGPPVCLGRVQPRPKSDRCVSCSIIDVTHRQELKKGLPGPLFCTCRKRGA